MNGNNPKKGLAFVRSNTFDGMILAWSAYKALGSLPLEEEMPKAILRGLLQEGESAEIGIPSSTLQSHVRDVFWVEGLPQEGETT